MKVEDPLMNPTFKPKTHFGSWSVNLTLFFVIGSVFSYILVNVLHILSFNDAWWDVFSLILFPTGVIAFITGMLAIRKLHEYSILVLLSVFIGFWDILYLIFYSMAI